MINKDDQKHIQTIGRRIKELRIKAGYTSHETFAQDKGIDRKQYWRLEKGYNFTIKTLIRIINIHEITLEQFFKGLE